MNNGSLRLLGTDDDAKKLEINAKYDKLEREAKLAIIEGCKGRVKHRHITMHSSRTKWKKITQSNLNTNQGAVIV